MLRPRSPRPENILVLRYAVTLKYFGPVAVPADPIA